MTGPIATMMINRIGIRVTIMLGGVITLLGYSLSSIAPNIATLFFSYGVVAGNKILATQNMSQNKNPFQTKFPRKLLFFDNKVIKI